ncbi:hypothetical protein GCM10009039_31980 [Halocalculus aciditolerans]|uniref:Uncharacterized protein n=1 Tax=Halocalculus aciditolerans TaxID=1383812 RepID=A0A830F7Q5_9EURY|nr:hypothetical protein GCM10009039_31980 [Halocalculus aciditolerans]
MGPGRVVDAPEVVGRDVAREEPNRGVRVDREDVGDRTGPEDVSEGGDEFAHTNQYE